MVCIFWMFPVLLVIHHYLVKNFISKTNRHLRLWHVSERGLVELSKQYFLGSEQLNTLKFHDHCILGSNID